MSLRQKIAYNTLASFTSRIAGTALALVTLGLTTRYLGQFGFGEYSIVFGFLYTFNVLADFGLYSILTREISKPENFDNKERERRIVSEIFTLRVILLVLFFSLSSLIVWLFPYSFQVKVGVIIGSLHFVFLSLSQVLMGIFQKRLIAYKVALAEIITRTVQFLLTVAFVKLLLGFESFILIMVLSGFVQFAVVVFFARQQVKFKIIFEKSKAIRIFKESFPLFLAMTLNFLYFKFDTVLLSLMRSPEEVGIYNAAYKVLENVIFLPAAFAGLIIPILTRYFYQNKEQFKNVFQKGFDVLVITGLPIAVGGIALSGQIMKLIGGDQFIASALPLRILMPGIFFIFIGTLFGNTLITIGKQKLLIYVYAAAAAFSVLANLIFIPKYSYLASAAITSLSELLIIFLLVIAVLKTARFQPSVAILWKAAIASLLMFFALSFVKDYNLLISLSVGSIVYLVVLYVVGGIKKSDISLLLRRN